MFWCLKEKKKKVLIIYFDILEKCEVKSLRGFRSSPLKRGLSVASTNNLGEFGPRNHDSSLVLNFICSYFKFLYLLLVLNCFFITWTIEPFHFISLM